MVGHSRESVLGWALQGVSRVGHSGESLGVDGEEKSFGRGEELSLKSNNPTPKGRSLTSGHVGLSAEGSHPKLCAASAFTYCRGRNSC